MQAEAKEPNDAGGRAAAALFLRLGRAVMFAPLCKNSDAAWGRVLPPVERAHIDARDSCDARDGAGVFKRCSRNRDERHDGASSCVMGGLWTEHIKSMRSHYEGDCGTSDRAPS